VKSPPFVSPITPGVKLVSMSRSLALPASDAEHRSHVGWRLQRVAEASSPNRRAAGVMLRAEEAVDEPPAHELPEETAALEFRSSHVSPVDPGNATDAVDAEHAYQLWKCRVWRFMGRLGVPSEALEDATQDVFTAVFRRWDDFRGQSTRRTWVLGFVPRVASAYRRRLRKRHEPVLEQDSSAGSAFDEASGRAEHDPFESTARREATRLVRSFLDGLPDKDRQLFVLVDLEDASVVEAAGILELGIRRAYKNLERARRALEAALVRHRAAEGRRLP
jgi:RNA polymerase sigma-70 factor (ECF subfamily)